MRTHFILLLFLAACSPAAHSPAAAKAAGEAQSAQLREVRTATAREEVWERTLRISGELAAFETATLSTKVPGRLESLTVDLGARVERGALLARVDAHDYELRVTQAEAALAAARARLGLASEDDGKDEVDPASTAIVRQARAALDEARREEQRIAGLVPGGVASQAAADTARALALGAEARLQDAEEEVRSRRALLAQRRADLALARAQLADTSITAPFDGAVAARLAGTGDYLSAGAPIARIVRFDPLRLRLEVPEHAALAVRTGQLVRAELEGGQRADGRIARISPEISARNRALLVEGEFPNADGVLRPGSFASAEIVTDPAARALVVPLEALVRFAGIDKLIEVVDGKAVERRVTVGRIAGSRVEILGGIAPGAELVLGPGNLQGGAPVRATH